MKPDEEALGWIKWINGKMDLATPSTVLAVALKDGGTVVGLMGVAPRRSLAERLKYCLVWCERRVLPYDGADYLFDYPRLERAGQA